MRSDPGQAEVFVQQLTALYRYLVRHNHADWVELDEEIGFARSYVHLLEMRFGGAFRVAIELPAGSGFFVVPGLLQELLGNVVKHNHGSEDHPVDVTLRLEGERLVASNALRPKRYAEPRSGRGLATRWRWSRPRPAWWRSWGRLPIHSRLLAEGSDLSRDVVRVLVVRQAAYGFP